MRLKTIAFAVALVVCGCTFYAAFSVRADDANARKAPPPTKAPIRVLFLGDNGHHKPAERAKQLLPYLSSRGIEATYSENPNDLNPQTLGNYDCLLIYANIE